MQNLLRFLVVFMGVLIIAGIVTIVVTVVKRAKFSSDIILPQHISTYESEVTKKITIPTGYTVKHLTSLEGNFLMWIENPHGQEVWVLDSLEGRILRKFAISYPE